MPLLREEPPAKVHDGVKVMDVARVRMTRREVTQLGVIEGCLRYLGMPIDDAWLFGATGYAFMINIPEGAHCMGPQAWDFQSAEQRTPNLGFSIADTVHALREDPRFGEKQAEAKAFVERKLAAGIPCIGYEHGWPVDFVIYDTTDEGMWFHCHMAGSVLRKWEELGGSDVCTLHVGSVERLDTQADDATTVRDALSFALFVDDEPAEALGAQCTGLAAYDQWIEALQWEGLYSEVWFFPQGTAYNAGYWAECRYYAELFLLEAGRRLDPELQPLFQITAAHYADVARALRGVHRIYRGRTGDDRPTDEEAGRAVALLREAKEAEATGLAMIRHIVKVM